ncbi:MAG TPA: hypothetical protein VLN61_13205 [Pseudolabrys sp.]|nr:hypothetical protein [Pseudolabrys sp.]
MASLAVKLIVSAIGLALVLVAAAPADAAKARKHKKHVAAHAATATAKSGYRGTNLFPAGPVYFANDYLGDDPDPFIRLQLLRDLGAHYGGEP